MSISTPPKFHAAHTHFKDLIKPLGFETSVALAFSALFVTNMDLPHSVNSAVAKLGQTAIYFKFYKHCRQDKETSHKPPLFLLLLLVSSSS